MPFVVTMTFGAAACGGTVTERGGGGDGTGDTGGGGSGGGTIVGPSGGGALPIGTGGIFELGGAGGRFELGGAGGGNPPYPPRDTVCPPAPPGGACNYVGPPCGYYDCYGSPVTTAACLNGVWSVSTSSCNPPAPLEPCPTVVPQTGTYCNYQGDACGYHQFPEQGCRYLDTFALCNAHVWTVAVSACGTQDGGTQDGGTHALDSGLSAYPHQ